MEGKRSITVNNTVLNSTVFSSILITSTRATDTANYTCVAINEAGTANSSTSMVSVYGKYM